MPIGYPTAEMNQPRLCHARARNQTMNFDRLAPFYRAMETLAAGGKLQRCRLAFLGEIPIPRRVLLAGEGHGRFLVAEGKVAGLRSRVILAMLYAFFRLACELKARSLVPPDGEIQKAGFSRHRRITSDWGLLKSEWWRRG